MQSFTACTHTLQQVCRHLQRNQYCVAYQLLQVTSSKQRLLTELLQASWPMPTKHPGGAWQAPAVTRRGAQGCANAQSQSAVVPPRVAQSSPHHDVPLLGVDRCIRQSAVLPPTRSLLPYTTQRAAPSNGNVAAPLRRRACAQCSKQASERCDPGPPQRALQQQRMQHAAPGPKQRGAQCKAIPWRCTAAMLNSASISPPCSWTGVAQVPAPAQGHRGLVRARAVTRGADHGGVQGRRLGNGA